MCPCSQGTCLQGSGRPGAGQAYLQALLQDLEASCASTGTHMGSHPALLARGQSVCDVDQRERRAAQELSARAGAVVKRLQALLAALEAEARRPAWMRAASPEVLTVRAAQLRHV